MNVSRSAKRTTLALAVATLATGFALTTGSAAFAGPNDNNCDPGEICGFKNANRSGGLVDFSGNDSWWHGDIFRPTGGDADDEASSTWNRTGRRVGYYKDINCNGPLIFEEPGGFHLNLALNGFNDEISSNCFLP